MKHHWTSEQTHRHQVSLRRELGPVVVQALEDPDVTEVMLNPDGQLWLDTASHGMVSAETTMSAIQAASLIATIAGLLDLVIDPEKPILEAELPLDGSRFEGVLPPIAAAPTFAIRKRAVELYPLASYLAAGNLTGAQAEVLRDAISQRLNLLVSGGPGSGKTTFINALLQEMAELSASHERFFVLEDTSELLCKAPNRVPLHTSEVVTLRTLIRTTLRMRPDRIVIGEVRGAEAHELLKAWNTGNPGGCASLHANSAVDALERLDQLVQEAGVPSQARLIASTVHLVVHMERAGSRRRVQQLLSVQGYELSRGYLVEPLAETPPRKA